MLRNLGLNKKMERIFVIALQLLYFYNVNKKG